MGILEVGTKEYPLATYLWGNPRPVFTFEVLFCGMSSTTTILGSFYAELEKLAATIEELQAGYRRLPISNVSRSAPIAPLGPFAALSYSQAKATKPGMMQGVSPEQFSGSMRMAGIPGPGIYMPPRGGASGHFGKLMGQANLPNPATTPEAHRGLNVMAGIHEGQELAAAGLPKHRRSAPVFTGHHDYKVLFDESNMLARAQGPAALQGASALRSSRRTTREAQALERYINQVYGGRTDRSLQTPWNFRYGETHLSKGMKRDLARRIQQNPEAIDNILRQEVSRAAPKTSDRARRSLGEIRAARPSSWQAKTREMVKRRMARGGKSRMNMKSMREGASRIAMRAKKMFGK
jgi:hypothetical protein